MSSRITNNFWKYVDTRTPQECWAWLKSYNGNGYGQLWNGSKVVLAHRVAFELMNGPIPDGLCCLHRCDNRACVNPLHLFLGSKKDNAQDMAKKGRQHLQKNPNKVRGENNYAAKLTNEDVSQIRALWKTGTITQAAIAKQFHVDPSNISRIVNLHNWTYGGVNETANS